MKTIELDGPDYRVEIQDLPGGPLVAVWSAGRWVGFTGEPARALVELLRGNGPARVAIYVDDEGPIDADPTEIAAQLSIASSTPVQAVVCTEEGSWAAPVSVEVMDSQLTAAWEETWHLLFPEP